MKKTALLAAALLLLAPTMAFGLDITINDNMNPSATWTNTTNLADPRVGINEDSEVELNCTTGQQWDLEAVVLRTLTTYNPATGLMKVSGFTLTLVGGWNFMSSLDTWSSGDVFLAFNEAPAYGNDGGADHNGTGSNINKIISNIFGYDYALDVDRTVGTSTTSGVWDGSTYGYDTVALSASSSLTTTTYYDQNEGADPWVYTRGGTVVGEGTYTLATYNTDAALWAAYSELNGKITGAGSINSKGKDTDANNHYAVTFDISDIVMPLLKNLGEGQTLDMWTHFTQQCGNDNLMGYIELTKPSNIVPEPSSIALLLLGILGTFARKLRA